MSMSVDGLVSGMDTTSLITQLIQAEAGQQTALKKRLSSTQTAASAYRTVNTTFAAVRAAAEAITSSLWTSTKATSSSSTVSVSSTAGAGTGSLTFSVDKLATAHAVTNRNTGTWTSATSAYGAASIQVYDELGAAVGAPLAIGGTQTVADAAAAINGATALGLSAAVVRVSATEVALQVTSKTTGAASQFSFTGAGTFAVNTQARDAELSIGTTTPFTVTSDTNTFSSVLPGTSITVGKEDPAADVTVTVASDPEAVTGKIQALVDAVNSALTQVKSYTSNAPGSTAALKGDPSLTGLAGQLLNAVSGSVGTAGSPAQVGFQLTRDGKITFDKGKFTTALKDTPDLAQQIVGGIPASGGTPAVEGMAARLLSVAKRASDSATGSIVALANGKDSLAKEITKRIEAWDLRLAKRKETLSRQFSAMETALSSLKNQSTWLAGQINSLPSSS